MFAGELNPHQVDDLRRAIDIAERASGLTFSTFVGETDGDPRAEARALLNKLDDPAGSVLVLCDPDRRALEIVTGSRAHAWLDDRECRLATATMTSSFAAGDLSGGLARGIRQLGEAARHPDVLHSNRF